jgi:hypothetical protein
LSLTIRKRNAFFQENFKGNGVLKKSWQPNGLSGLKNLAPPNKKAYNFPLHFIREIVLYVFFMHIKKGVIDHQGTAGENPER